MYYIINKVSSLHHNYQFNKINDRKLFLKYKGPLSYNPASTLRTSLLSTESPEENYRGFINVLVIVLIVNHIISIYNSIKEYGIALEYVIIN